MHFKVYIPKNTHLYFLSLFMMCMALQSCASYGIQKGKNLSETSPIDSSHVLHQFFLIGGTGNAEEARSEHNLNLLQKRLKHAGDASTLLFLGDNINPRSLPSKKEMTYDEAKMKLETPLKISKNFKGNTIFIPGNHDWKWGISGLQAQEKAVKDYTQDKKSFLPRKGCPIEQLKMGNDLGLIAIDSEWYLQNWNLHPHINADCSVKSRENFFETLKDILNKNQQKTLVVALHHPLISRGSHAGYYGWKNHLYPFGHKFPLPLMGSFINILRSASGFSAQDLNNKAYTAFVKRIKSMVQNNTNLIFVSGHEHSLQYLEEKNIRQIISGAGSKKEAAKAAASNDFSFGGYGYAILSLHQNGGADVAYYSTEGSTEKLLTRIKVLDPSRSLLGGNKTENFPDSIKTSVYPAALTKKSKVYTWLWGKHYRKYYSLPIQAKTGRLDSLKGGLSPVRAGGGNQSNSLRLIADNQQEYAMRGIKKSAIRFLNAVAFKNETFGSELEGSFTEKFLFDFYTTAHPYTPFGIGNLSEKINIYHANPLLYYIPKQKKLESFNKNYGDELYMMEERFSGSPEDLKLLGGATQTLNTEQMMKNLRKSEKYRVDIQSYIRARLFDMLLGDWDRHADQWRWAEYKRGDSISYKPIPKDRDQAFSKYDGILLKIIMQMPPLRHMQSFKEKIRNIKWFNREPYPLDLALLKTATQEDWQKEAKYIQQQLTDEAIEHAFDHLPPEVQDATLKDIQQKLKIRRNKINQYAKAYHRFLEKTVVLAGTDKEDRFVIRKEKNKILLSQYRIKKGGDQLIFQRLYSPDKTKEIWVYGLDGDDVFEVSGKGNTGIKIRLIGGPDHDTYRIEDGKNISLYDFKSLNNTYAIKGSVKRNIKDDYQVNTYHYKKPQYNFWMAYPQMDYNPDDGIKTGASTSYTHNGFHQNPFTSQQRFKTYYAFATQGIELMYEGVFPDAIGAWALHLNTRFATPNFSQNYFGFGNHTPNPEKELGKNYNRVRIQQLQIQTSLSKKSFSGITQALELSYEDYRVQYTPNRFITQSALIPAKVFNSQRFWGAQYRLSYDHSDHPAFPTMGFGFEASAAWKMNLEDPHRNFMTYSARLNLTHRIDAAGRFVLASRIQVKYINNSHYDFFQGADLGGNDNLRSFRNNRFMGRSSIFQSSDLRWNFGRLKNSIMPVNFGMLLGYDYGRIWLDHEYSRRWHQSVGGGIWLSILEAFSARVTYFQGSDGGRLSAGLGFRF
ncbi:BamA/TamA family outer membrane protein [Elizabethkingia argentiflava]|uniref:BamA/TamA family outer membrane protein n=1 Tax=Elizabethkingia argenteiflava TaxID=2681556 RepID=A0A845PVK0_9FLAO|nr:metallophosphoesterase [Elizabethkingia argenteiflava]NAW51163.1 BamA/TamA family outer membrane protein [Elizabethkingia argenteiflava]